MTARTLNWISLVRQLFAWLVSGLLCFVFLGAGGAKLAAQPMMIAQFQSFGYPVWFMYLIGAIEFTAAILVMIPRTSRAAAVALGCVMVGAISSLAIHNPHERIAGPVVLLGLAATAFLLRRT
jgi:putative oxidoreductase